MRSCPLAQSAISSEVRPFSFRTRSISLMLCPQKILPKQTLLQQECHLRHRANKVLRVPATDCLRLPYMYFTQNSGHLSRHFRCSESPKMHRFTTPERIFMSISVGCRSFEAYSLQIIIILKSDLIHTPARSLSFSGVYINMFSVY